MNWGPWINFKDSSPSMGMYVQIKLGCLICRSSPLILECMWGLSSSIRCGSDEKIPCEPEFIEWRKRNDGREVDVRRLDAEVV